jgi:hypothetical protein
MSFFDLHSEVWHQAGALIRLLGKLYELGQATSKVPGGLRKARNAWIPVAHRFLVVACN